MAILAPSILSADFSNLSQQIRLVELGGADWIHCDIMDGHFVPNLTFGPLIVEAVNRITQLPLDVHLMIENPEKYLKNFISAGANYLTIHSEAVSNLGDTLKRIKDLGCKAGVSIKPATSIDDLKNILTLADMILVMSVDPGFGGQEFIEPVLEKVKNLVALRKQTGANFLVEIDGGINKQTILPSLKAGVDVFVVGSTIYKSNNITASSAELKNILRNYK